MMQIKAMVGVMLVLTLAGGGAVLYAVNAANSSILRTVAVGAYPGSVAVDGPAARIVVGSDDGGVSVLEARSGTVLYTVKGGRSRGGAPVAVDTDAGHAFISGFGSGVRMLDTRAGTILHTLMVGTGLSAVAVDGRLRRAFITDSRRQAVLVLDTRRGTVVQTIKVGQNPNAVAVDRQSGRVFVAWGAHRVSVLDARSGRVVRTLTGLGRGSGALVRTVRVGQFPAAVAVDERVGRAFVANTNSNSVSVLDTHAFR